MTVQEAVEVLRAHNEWRRGNRTENWGPMPYSPKEIGLAIAIACDYIEQSIGDAKTAGKEGTP